MKKQIGRRKQFGRRSKIEFQNLFYKISKIIRLKHIFNTMSYIDNLFIMKGLDLFEWMREFHCMHC